MIPLDFLKAASLADQLVAAGVPIETVRRTGGQFEIVYATEATGPQRVQGAAILAAFDASDNAERLRQNAVRSEAATLRDQATTAVQANDAYLGLADAATPAQVRAQVKRLTQQNNVIIRRLVQLSERL